MCCAERQPGNPVQVERDSRTNLRLNLMELSSTLELPWPHAEGDGIRDTYPASQHRLRLFSRACLETPRRPLGSDPIVGSKITIAVEETRADPSPEIFHQRQSERRNLRGLSRKQSSFLFLLIPVFLAAIFRCSDSASRSIRGDLFPSRLHNSIPR